MIEFNNDAEIWAFLIDGGTVVKKGDCEDGNLIDWIKIEGVNLIDGKKTFTDGVSARGCLLTYGYWVGLNRV